MPVEREIIVSSVIYKKNKQGISILLENNEKCWNLFFDSIDEEKRIEDKIKVISQQRSTINEIRLIADLGCLKYWFQNGKNLMHRRVYSFLFETPQTYNNDVESKSDKLKWFTPEESHELLPTKDSKLILDRALEKLKVTLN
ncbi:MAG: hypothetical protein WCW17_03400 [Patescibacteria group bacterium]|jgi:hypothetical protein